MLMTSSRAITGMSNSSPVNEPDWCIKCILRKQRQARFENGLINQCSFQQNTQQGTWTMQQQHRVVHWMELSATCDDDISQ